MAPKTLAKKKVNHAYIIRDKRICDGSPIIVGTRTRVIDIAVEYDRLGYSPDEIANAHPHLNLSQIHDALSYYYENQTELDKEMAIKEKRTAELKKIYISKIEGLLRG